MSSFDRAYMTSYWRSIVNMALSVVVSEIFNVKKYRNLEITVKDQSRSLKVVPFDTLDMVSYCSIVTLSLSFWDIRPQTCRNRVMGSVTVIETVTIRWSACDFQLTLHSNHGPISYRFRDTRRFQSKIAKFSHPIVFCAPAEGVRLGIGYQRRGSEN